MTRSRPRSHQDLFGTLSRFVMSDTLGPEYLRTLARLEAAMAGVEHVIVGGQAVFFSGWKRFCEDIEVGVLSSAGEIAERLTGAGFTVLRSSRFIDPETEIEVGVITLPPCTAPHVRRPVRVVGGPGLELPIIDLAALVALKVKRGSMQDEADVVELHKAGAQPMRAKVVKLLRALGERAESYDRLVEIARTEKP